MRLRRYSSSKVAAMKDWKNWAMALLVVALFAVVGHFDYEATQATADPAAYTRR